MKSQGTYWVKMFIVIYLIKDLYPEYIIKLLKLYKKTNNPVKCPNDLNQYFKKDKHMKDAHYH